MMQRRAWRLRTIAATVLFAACGTRPGADSTQGDSAAAAGAETPRAGSPSIIASCCPGSDVAIQALIARYESTPEAERPPEVALWPYRLSSGLDEAGQLVVRDSAAWAALWPRMLGTHSPKPRPPAVDFSREMLIVASMGTRPTGGFVVFIESAATVGDSLRVVVREQSPGPRCGTTAALSAPVALARVTRTELPVSFVARRVVRDCP